MLDFLIQATLSNLVVSTILAVIAWGVQRQMRSPGLANLLWALVLVKMVTPPMVALPVLEIPRIKSSQVNQTGVSGARPLEALELPTNEDNFATLGSAIPSESNRQFIWTNNDRPIVIAVGFTCLAISLLLCLFSFVRIIRFHWTLVEHTHKNDRLTDTLATSIAQQFGLKKRPKLFVTKANVVPFVWWIQGRSAIVLPEKAVHEMARDDLRLVIAHEMAHIKRRDHWFRWVEWLALISLWWNPVMWWARKQLRITEELACDELVLETVGTKTTNYANSLLNMAELLATSAIRPPVVASAINSGGNLEKRLKMIIDDNSTRFSSGLRAVILAVATCLFPLGLVSAQDFEAVERRLGLAVHEGELSLEQAHVMMEALKRTVHERDHEYEERHVVVRRIVGALSEAGVREDSIEATIEVIRKLAGDIAKRGNSFELDEEVVDYLSDKLRLNERQIDLVVEIAERLADSEEDEGDNRKRHFMSIVERVKAAVERGELSEEEADRKLHELREEMFEEEDESEREHEHEERHTVVRRIVGALSEAGVQEDSIEATIEVIRKLAGEIAEQGNGFELDEGYVDYLSDELNLSGRQIDLAVELAERLADSEEDEGDNRKRHFMSIVERVKSAVERGELSEEEAERKLRQVREEMSDK